MIPAWNKPCSTPLPESHSVLGRRFLARCALIRRMRAESRLAAPYNTKPVGQAVGDARRYARCISCGARANTLRSLQWQAGRAVIGDA